MTSALDSIWLLLRGVGLPVFRLVLVDWGFTCLTLVVDTCMLLLLPPCIAPLQNLCCHLPPNYCFAPSFLSADASSFTCLLGSMDGEGQRDICCPFCVLLVSIISQLLLRFSLAMDFVKPTCWSIAWMERAFLCVYSVLFPISFGYSICRRFICS